MSSFDFDVSGEAALQRKLTALSDEVGDFSDPGAESARILKAESRRRAPRDKGTLASTVTASSTAAGRVSLEAGTGGAEEYANRQHWKQQKGKAGHQFVWRAMGAKGRTIVGLYRDNVDRMVDRFNRSGTRG